MLPRFEPEDGEVTYTRRRLPSKATAKKAKKAPAKAKANGATASNNGRLQGPAKASGATAPNNGRLQGAAGVPQRIGKKTSAGAGKARARASVRASTPPLSRQRVCKLGRSSRGGDRVFLWDAKETPVVHICVESSEPGCREIASSDNTGKSTDAAAQHCIQQHCLCRACSASKKRRELANGPSTPPPPGHRTA